MSGRSRKKKKKLVRSKRLHVVSDESIPVDEVETTTHFMVTTETKDSTRLGLNKSYGTTVASIWSEPIEMGENHPQDWKRPAVKALELQEAAKVGANGNIPGTTLPSPLQDLQIQTPILLSDISPPPLWGDYEKFSAPSKKQKNVYSSKRCICDEISKDDIKENSSIYRDPLMYATFVAPIQQHSTDFEAELWETEGQNSSENTSNIWKNSSDAWPAPPLPLNQRTGYEEMMISQDDLNIQTKLERLSFMSEGSNIVSNEDGGKNGKSSCLGTIQNSEIDPDVMYFRHCDTTTSQWGSSNEAIDHPKNVDPERWKYKRSNNVKQLDLGVDFSFDLHNQSKNHKLKDTKEQEWVDEMDASESSISFHENEVCSWPCDVYRWSDSGSERRLNNQKTESVYSRRSVSSSHAELYAILPKTKVPNIVRACQESRPCSFPSSIINAKPIKSFINPLTASTPALQSPSKNPTLMHRDDETLGRKSCWSGLPEAGVNDIAQLPQNELSASGIVANLKKRFKNDLIYTNIGTCDLILINPYQKTANLFTQEVIDAYHYHCLHQLPPHIYAVTDRAWRRLRDFRMDQCILLSGEASSGKTETSKHVLQYLSAVTSSKDQFHTIKTKILQSGLLLEAFGNAITRYNSNSSRFGKYFEIFFDFKGDPLGAFITIYHLAKNRLIEPLKNERNFHIFYQLLAGSDAQLLKELRLQRSADAFCLLRRITGSHDIENKSIEFDRVLKDRKAFQRTYESFRDLGFSDFNVHSIFALLASILKLGNLCFVPITNMDGTEGCSISNDYELYEIADILHVDVDQFQTSLVTRTIELSDSISSSSLNFRGQTENVSLDLNANQAATSRDRICKSIYSRLFVWLVSKINESFKSQKQIRKNNALSILDMYGFEAPSVNNCGIEQLIINYANEKLHRATMHWTLSMEQEELKAEGLSTEWNMIETMFDNGPVCNLLDSSTNSIFSILDEISLDFRHDKTDENDGGDDDDAKQQDKQRLMLRDAFSRVLHKNPYFQTELDDQCMTFRIKHYAGNVKYHYVEFLSRNVEVLDRNISRVMFQSTHQILKQLFPEGNPKKALRKRPVTTAIQFKISIASLINRISNTKFIHYVHCMKSNENAKARLFTPETVQHQISYMELLGLAKLRKNGFYFRQDYEIFLERYKMLSIHTWPRWTCGPCIEGVTYLLRDLPICVTEYSFGRTLIFIRTSKTIELLEDFRKARLDYLATLLQKIFRGYLTRKAWDRLRASQIVISRFWKQWKKKSHIVEIKQERNQNEAALVIQRCFRKWRRKCYLIGLAQNIPPKSPISKVWSYPHVPKYAREANSLLKKLFHKWRCHRYRLSFDQISRNRMREKVTASLIFKDRKSSYQRSLKHSFRGDYVNLRRKPAWQEALMKNGLIKTDNRVVFADIANKIHRSNGKFVPILFVISTNSMLIMDQRTMQIKYRIPAAEIYKLSLSPFQDDIAVFHVRTNTVSNDESRQMLRKSQSNIPRCLSSQEAGSISAGHRKGDFVFQTGHIVEIITKIFLVVQNATGTGPSVNIATQFEANFGDGTFPSAGVTFIFRPPDNAETTGGHVKIIKRGDTMEVIVA